MSCTSIVDNSDRDEWCAWASEFDDNNIYQSWSFADLRAAEMGADVSRIVIRRGERLIGMAQARIKKILFSSAGIAYVFRGPLWRRPGCRPADFRDVLDALHREYANRRKLALRLVPALTDAHPEPAVEQSLADTGFQRDDSADLQRTILLDLTPSLEELYDQMWKKKRFESGITIRSFRDLQRALHESEKLHVLLAYADDGLVAGHVSSTRGDTCIYLLGASNDRGRELKASYMLQWRTVESARSAGAKWYDLGGIDQTGNPGVYHFKSGLKGIECSFLGQYQACCAQQSRLLVPLLERARKALQAVRRFGVASNA